MCKSLWDYSGNLIFDMFYLCESEHQPSYFTQNFVYVYCLCSYSVELLYTCTYPP